MTVLVTDGEQRSTLAVTRSLGRAGHRVYVSALNPTALAVRSRYCAGFIPSADALTEPSRFGADIVTAVRSLRPAVILPVTDQAAFALLDIATELGDAIVPLPDRQAVHQVADKAQVLARADSLGIATPSQLMLSEPPAATPAVGYPVVIKPARSVVGRKHVDVAHASDSAALSSALAALSPAAYPVMLQQRIMGPGIGVFLLLWDGQPLASFAHERLREFPPSGGAATLSRSVALPADLLDRSLRLMQSFAWRGVSMIEYKRNEADGRHYLMEVNGRFWGSLQLAIDAGVDFPRLLVEAATGRNPTGTNGYRVGIRLRSLWRDIDQLLLRLRYDARALNLPPGTPGRLAALLSFLAWRPSERSELFRMDDSGPFWAETREWFARRARLRR